MGSTTSTVVPYFLYSSGILFREGLEAMLVIIALVAGTRQAGQGRHARDIYTGALIALASSIVLAWVVNHVIGDNTSDTLEGVFQLFAAATLFYVSSWITSKAQAQRWRKFISTQVEIARRSKGPSLALSFVVLKRLAYLLPIGPVFSATSVLLYALAVIFAGQGVASFQESGVLSATFINHVPTIQMLGIFPTVQTLTAQAILLVLALASVFTPLVRRLRTAPESPVASRTVPPVASHAAPLQRAS